MMMDLGFRLFPAIIPHIAPQQRNADTLLIVSNFEGQHADLVPPTY
jgi:hypothetical protein